MKSIGRFMIFFRDFKPKVDLQVIIFQRKRKKIKQARTGGLGQMPRRPAQLGGQVLAREAKSWHGPGGLVGCWPCMGQACMHAATALDALARVDHELEAPP
jgi:hypothetical protein